VRGFVAVEPNQKALDGALQRRRLAANQGIAILVDTVPDVVFERAVNIAGADGAGRRQQSVQRDEYSLCTSKFESDMPSHGVGLSGGIFGYRQH
jgi:hypothetical protein